MHLLREEFEGTTLNTDVWSTHFEAWGLRTLASTGQQQYYVTNGWEGLSVTPHLLVDGRLYLQAEASPTPSLTGNLPYTSGMISTEKSCVFRYGTISVRAACPKGQGFWPAIWLIPADGGDHLPEIDMFEALGHDAGTLYQYAHLIGEAPAIQLMGAESHAVDTSRFHHYELRWTKDTITWVVDGAVTRIVRNYCFEPHYLIINLAVGGYWPGNPDATTRFPSSFAIDHVRIF